MFSKPNKVRMSKHEQYELLYRDGTCLPPYKSAAITIQYLDGVEDGRYFVVKFEDVKVRGCFSPPEKKYVWAALQEELGERNIELGIKNMDRVPSDWLLLMLSSVNSQHPFFDPNYYPDQPTMKEISIALASSLTKVPGFRSQSKHIQMAQSNLQIENLNTQLQ